MVVQNVIGVAPHDARRVKMSGPERWQMGQEETLGVVKRGAGGVAMGGLTATGQKAEAVWSARILTVSGGGWGGLVRYCIVLLSPRAFGVWPGW